MNSPFIIHIMSRIKGVRGINEGNPLTEAPFHQDPQNYYNINHI